MVQNGRDLDFLQEPIGSNRRGEIWPQHLHGDVATVLLVPCQINRRHSATPEHPFEHVAIRQSRL